MKPNGAPRLQVLDKLNDVRLVGRRVEVADQVTLPRHAHAAGIDPVRDRLAVALKTGRRDAEAVSAAVRRIELIQVDRLPRRRAEHDHRAIVQLAKDALGGGH